MRKSTKQILVSAAVAGMMSFSALAADEAAKSDKVDAAKPAAPLGKCTQKNDCKGKGGCKTEANACNGQNTCKNHVFESSKADCKKAKGSWKKA